MKINLVISRYNESLTWLETIDCNSFNAIYIYNKGDEAFLFKNKNIVIIDLPNVGKCDHTYLYHIVNHYNDDVDVTIFVPGSCDMNCKLNRMQQTLSKPFTTGTSVFFCDTSTTIPGDVGDFSLESYTSSHEENLKKNPESVLQLCHERPYKAWFEKHFGNISIRGITYNGIFAVSKDHIHNRQRWFYNTMLKYVDQSSNPESGHYIERSWLAIFHPIPDDCKFVYTY